MLGWIGRFVDSLIRECLGGTKILLVVLIGVLAGQSYLPPFRAFFDKCELAALDHRMRARPDQSAHSKILIVEIDSNAVEFMGRPPWSNDKLALLVRALSGMGAKSIVFDFPVSRSTGTEGDALLVDAMVRAGNVYLPIAFSQVRDSIASGATAVSLAPFRDAAAGEGHVHCVPDDDGVFRRVVPRLWFDAAEVWQLSLRVALDAYEVDSGSMVDGADGIRLVDSSGAPVRIPLTHDDKLVLNYTGKWPQSFRRVSSADSVLSYERIGLGKEPSIPVSVFEDAFCMVGITAQGLYDARPTPLGQLVPPVVVTATVLNSVLEGNFISHSRKNTDAIILWAFCAVLAGIILVSGFARSLFRMFLLTLLYGATAHLLLIYAHTALPAARPAALVFFTFCALIVFHQVTTTMERRRLMRLVVKDGLTGLYNFEHFKLLLNAEIHNIELRSNKQVSIIMTDIDFFKKINDTFGHHAGDKVIRSFAEMLRNNCRSLDVACRYGGEEFILMLPGTPLEEAGKIAERIRKSFEDYKLELGDAKVEKKVTASFGVATYYPNETMDGFVHRADRALYKAKKAGRNMVCRV